MPGLSRLTLTVIGVYAALAALVLTTDAWLRNDIRALGDDLRLLRDEFRIENRGVRTGARMDREAWRAEARAEREARRAEREAWRAEFRADHAAFESQVLRLMEQQGIGRVRLDGDSNQTSSVGE